MEKIAEVKHAAATVFDLVDRRVVTVGGLGVTSTPGWSDPTLSPRVYVTPPADGIWDMDFVATRPEPGGVMAQVETPVGAMTSQPAPDWLRGVRLHANRNKVEAEAMVVLGAE